MKTFRGAAVVASVAPWLPRVSHALTTVVAVAACLVSSLMVLVATAPEPGATPGIAAALGMLTATAGAVALIWRHRHPEVVTFAASMPPLLFVTDSLAALVALAALAARRRDHVLWVGAGVVFAATLVAVERDSHRDPEFSPMQWMFGAGIEDGAVAVDVPLVAVVVVAALMTAIPVAVGSFRHARGEIGRRAETEQSLLADKARYDERTRIAREMHDVLGHRLSLLSLQAGALEADAADAGPARTIRQTARQSLDDLRHVVGVLRDGGTFDGAQLTGPDAPPAPYVSPSLADLPDLIDATRRSGVPVNATVYVDDAADAPRVLGTAVYRILQEALTNVARHAPGGTADVTVRGRPTTGVNIEVTNPLPVPLPAGSVAGNGTGLIGMTERATTLGGIITSGPDDDAFTVAVWLPWSVTEEADT